MAALTTLDQERDDIAQLVTAAGLPAYASVPERITPPAAIVLPDQPYLTQDETTQCGDWRIRHRLCVLGAKGTNDQAGRQLDLHIVQAVTALELAGRDVRDVAEPAEVELNGAGYLGTVVTVESLTTIGEL